MARSRSSERGEGLDLLLVDALITIPFRSEIMELPLVALTIAFSLGALVVLGRWWER